MIYAVLVFTKLEFEKGFSNFGSERLVGYFFDKDDAINHVKENVCDIWETCYNYAIVEGVKPGFYEPADKEDRWLFKFNHETGEYEQIEEPGEMAHLCGFTIG